MKSFKYPPVAGLFYHYINDIIHSIWYNKYSISFYYFCGLNIDKATNSSETDEQGCSNHHR
ncbi:hypothetical protein ACSSV5_001380 [Psychroflexus sp. MBR-150]|jgi:hypothetical protein